MLNICIFEVFSYSIDHLVLRSILYHGFNVSSSLVNDTYLYLGISLYAAFHYKHASSLVDCFHYKHAGSLVDCVRFIYHVFFYFLFFSLFAFFPILCFSV